MGRLILSAEAKGIEAATALLMVSVNREDGTDVVGLPQEAFDVKVAGLTQYDVGLVENGLSITQWDVAGGGDRPFYVMALRSHGFAGLLEGALLALTVQEHVFVIKGIQPDGTPVIGRDLVSAGRAVVKT